MKRLLQLLSITTCAISVGKADTAATNFDTTAADLAYYSNEIAYLNQLKGRVTGSASQNRLIDHIECQLETLGFDVQYDILNFSYFKPCEDYPPSLSIAGESIKLSSSVPYSGATGPKGVTGQLVNLISNGSPIDWTKAAGKIAVVNVTNSPVFIGKFVPPWPGSASWDVQPGNPFLNAQATITPGVFTAAKAAGVKGIVWTWNNITTGNADNQYVPFGLLYQDLPAVFVAGGAASKVVHAANTRDKATLTMRGKIVPNMQTRTVWVVINGTQLSNESVIINTHTDGMNSLEENGHIGLLHYAKHLVTHRPKRTTIFVFVTGHLLQPAFTPNGTGRAMERWMTDHPSYWRGGPGELKAVAGSCVEHLGAVAFTENISRNYYAPNTSVLAEELLWASTDVLNNLTRQLWHGAYPRHTRVNNPSPPGKQLGEGEAFFLNDIPNISLVTSPAWLTAIFGPEYDERKLIDVKAMGRQIGSFMRIWRAWEGLEKGMFGAVSNATVT